MLICVTIYLDFSVYYFNRRAYNVPIILTDDEYKIIWMGLHANFETLFDTYSVPIIKLIRKGIPKKFRPKIWQHLLDSGPLLEKNPELYKVRKYDNI